MASKPELFNKGLNTDISPIKQPDGTYRFALNAVYETADGNFTDLSSEEGNAPCSQLQDDDLLKASKLLDDNSRLLFVYNTATNTSIIYREDNRCNLETIIFSSCFNWDANTRIDIEYRLFKGCERVIYFTDGINPVYRINIDSLIDYVPDSVINDDSISSYEDKIRYTQLNDIWDCGKLQLDRNVQFPRVEFSLLNNFGGSLKVGTYQFAIRYLDNDLNPTNWLFLTNPIPVVDENTSASYYQIDGGVSGVSSSDATGDSNLGPINKSIDLDVSNLDLEYTYYQIGVLEITGNTGNVSDVYYKPVREIISDSDIYTFTGTNSTEDIPGDIADITASRASIYRADHILQKDNRLLLSNVRQKPYDWYKFQQKASQIGSKYVTQQIQKRRYNNSPKSGEYYYHTKSYLRDEVYAFAIVYVFNNGTESPAFHIPGRPINWDPVNGKEIDTDPFTSNPLSAAWDSQTINVDSLDINHSEAIPDDLRPTHERWQTINTAYPFGDGTGLMAYYSVKDTYPNITTCSGESTWGVDIAGSPLAGRPIRHHKFPTSRLEKYQDKNYIYPIGVEFFNIEVPDEYADDIQGYYIVRDQRREVNKTIYDKGILEHAGRTNTERITFFGNFEQGTGTGSFSNVFDNFDYQIYSSPKGYFKRDFVRGSYINFEGAWNQSAVLNTTLTNIASDNIGGNNSEIRVYLYWDEYTTNFITSNPYQLITRNIAQHVYVDAIPESLFDGSSVIPTRAVVEADSIYGAFYNYLASTHLSVMYMPGSTQFGHIVNKRLPNYVSQKVFKDVYSNLFSLRYIKTHVNVESPTQSSKTVYGGDIFISKFEWSYQDYDRSRIFNSAYVESEINTDLKHGSDDVCDQVFKGNWFVNDLYNFDLIPSNVSPANAILSLDIDDYIFRFHVQDYPPYTESDTSPNNFVCKDPFLYNDDFTKENNQRQYASLPINFDYCSDCLNEFPYRIYYSQQSFQEETTDNYISFLPNNYSDLMGDQGPISNMFVDRDALYVHCNKAIWNIQTKPNEIQANESTIYLGTGELLSIPPRKMVSTDYGYAGSNQKWATVVTEHGAFFADTNLGKVFLLGKGLEEISNNGVTSFFEENLKLFFLDEFKSLTGLDFPNTHALNHNSVGVIAVYDPRYKRYILHKKDFTLTDRFYEFYVGEFENANSIQSILEYFIYYNTLEGKFYRIDNSGEGEQVVELDFRDELYFINKSFTVSYNALTKSWVSFHSYMPTYMYNDANTFYTFVANSGNTYRHGGRLNYQEFYGTKHPYVIEYVSKSDKLAEVIFGSIRYISTVTRYNQDTQDNVEISNKTFDEFYCYTRDQITSSNTIVLKSLNPYSTISADRDISYAARVDNSFRISKNIKDIAINRNTESLLSKRWSDPTYSSYFNTDGLGNGYIDYVPNEQARDLDKSVYSRANMKDKYIRVRLFFNPSEPLRMSLQVSSNFTADKQR